MLEWVKGLFNRPKFRINMEPRQHFGKIEDGVCRCWCCGWSFYVEDRDLDYWTVTCPEYGCGATVHVWKENVEENLKTESE